MRTEVEDFDLEKERLEAIAAARLLQDIHDAEEAQLAKVVAQRNKADTPFSWHLCPQWEEDEASPGLGVPWRDPSSGGFRYFSIKEIERVLMRGHY